jgi:hypothetical protein
MASGCIEAETGYGVRFFLDDSALSGKLPDGLESAALIDFHNRTYVIAS